MRNTIIIVGGHDDRVACRAVPSGLGLGLGRLGLYMSLGGCPHRTGSSYSVKSSTAHLPHRHEDKGQPRGGRAKGRAARPLARGAGGASTAPIATHRHIGQAGPSE